MRKNSVKNCAQTRGLLPGGKLGNKGGGRPADWLKEKCQKIIADRKIIEFLADVAGGKNFIKKTSFDAQGNQITADHPAEVKDRLHAAEILLERGFGKPAQTLEVPSEGAGRFIVVAG